jgi:hypothetical protein
MGQSITPEMRDLRIEVYEGGKDAGLQLTGRSDWGEFKEILAGSQRDPLEHWDTPDTSGTKIGMSGEMTVAVGADGRLVNQARHRRPGDAPSTHLLKIDVRPTVVFGVDRNEPLTRWVANVTVFELTTEGVVIGESSADTETERRLAGKRPIHEYGNDPEYRAALPGLLHETPREAVRAVLQKISSGGLINLPPAPNPATSAPIAVTPEPETAPSEAGSGRPGWLLPLLGIGAVAAIIIALLTLTGGGESEADLADVPAPSATPAPSVAPPAPTPSVAIVVPEPSVAATTTTTMAPTTTTTEPPIIDETALEILDQRCVVRSTGVEDGGCLHPTQIVRFGADPTALVITLADGGGFGPETVGTLSLFLSNGLGNDLLVECDTDGDCQSWAAPSFFNVETEWFPVQFGELNTEVGFVFELIDRGDGSAGFLVPALEATDGTQLPPGEYRVTEGVVFVESDGLQSTTLFGDEFTVWFD